MANDCKGMEINEESSDKLEEEVEDLEWTTEQEIHLLYSLHGYKPVGPVKYFNMFVIQKRLSNALNKPISSKCIWKKLNTMYDLEALDEAEAELSALEKVEIDFVLPESEYGELMNAKIAAKEMTIKVENQEEDGQNNTEGSVILTEIKTEPQTNEGDIKDSAEQPKGLVAEKGYKKEIVKRGAKKKDSIPTKDNIPLKKDNLKEASKKDTSNKKEFAKELKKGVVKEDEKKETGKKTLQDVKKDIGKEDKKENPIKASKRESAFKNSTELSKKELELKKSDQKKTPNQRGGTTQPRSETPKRSDAKTLRSETPKPLRADATTKPQRVEAIRKDTNADKKKETPDKAERKSPEKTPDSVRGTKLRAREKKEPEPETTGTKRERSKESTLKAMDTSTEEPLSKKAKLAVPKGRPTRNSSDPQQKPASPVPFSQKRRARP